MQLKFHVLFILNFQLRRSQIFVTSLRSLLASLGSDLTGRCKFTLVPRPSSSQLWWVCTNSASAPCRITLTVSRGNLYLLLWSFCQCVGFIFRCVDLFSVLYETGGVPFEILEPVLERCTPEQLLRIEEYNPVSVQLLGPIIILALDSIHWAAGFQQSATTTHFY